MITIVVEVDPVDLCAMICLVRSSRDGWRFGGNMGVMSQVTTIPVCVIGAGHAGLSMSRTLQAAGIDHVVLERDRVGESWRSMRWDSFRVNTPNGLNALPDFDYDGDEPDGFFHRDELVGFLERYCRTFDLPVRTGVEVMRVVGDAGGTFTVEAQDGQRWQSSNVVVCSGIQNVPRTPSMARSLPRGLHQLHTADYRSPEALPPGGVVVVGGAQSGVQIAEELAEAGRQVYLCSSRVGRGVRRYRGRDLVDWFEVCGIGRQTVQDLPDPQMQFWPQPQISGTRGGHTLSLQSLGRLGVVLLGRLMGIDGDKLVLGDDLLANVAWADRVSTELKSAVDRYIDAAGVDAPPPEDDPAEAAFDQLEAHAEIRRLSVGETGIRTVLWATGFGGDYSYLNLDLGIDDHGIPTHSEGVSPISGLYFLSLPWMRTRFSGIIPGIRADVESICSRMVASGLEAH